MFEIVRSIHIGCVALSGLFFLYRGYLLFRHQRSPRRPWLRHTADTIDTLLLLSGITLAWLISQAPWANPWLAAKLLALMLYILLGMAAFRWLRQTRWCKAAWVAAIATYIYMIAVAVTQKPWPTAG